MQVGFHVPQWGPAATRIGVTRVAQTVEDAGLDSVWVGDHLVFPMDGSDKTYPYQPETPFRPEDGFLEALTVLAVLAGTTSRVKLGTSVMVMPMRDVLVTAKVASTIDVLSGGRLVLAMGAGWWQAEFEALGQRFAGRGARFDEQIQVMRSLWRDGVAAHAGPSIEFARLACEPRPLQPGGIPVLIGGNNARAHIRAGRLGDGWHGAGVHPETLVGGYAAAQAAAQEAGRDPTALTFSTSTVLPPDSDTALRRMERLREAGVHQVVLTVQSDDVGDICSAIENFASSVWPRLA